MHDRFAPESYEDFLTRGRTSREAARIRQDLADAEARDEIRRNIRFNENDCGGAFDGNTVSSDADSGL